MNWKKIIGIIVALVIVALFIFKLKTNKKLVEEKVYHFDKEQAVYVQTDTIRIENIDAEYFYSGTFEPNKESKISSESQGKINRFLVDAGSIVRSGQLLIQLDNSLLKLQLQTVVIQIEGLEADVNRYTILAKADAIQGVQLEKAVLALKSAKVQKAILQEQINKTTIKAPFTGVVTAKLSEEGSFASPGIPLIQLTDISNLKFTVNVPEHDLNLFKLNQNYTITADSYAEMFLVGKVNLIGSKANIGSSFPVQFLVKNTPDLGIKSGMFGKVLVKNNTSEMGIIIPSSAIQGTDNQPQVYIVKNRKAVLKNITISKKVQNKAIVSNGLNKGEVIVTNGFINLFDGANVIVK